VIDLDDLIPEEAELRPHYYECHVTIEPIEPTSTRFGVLQLVTERHGFKLAKLYMQKGVRSDKDAFCTAHSKSWEDIYVRMSAVVRALKFECFEVRRYKIESVVLDSRHGD
jgi:hypothetical protein